MKLLLIGAVIIFAAAGLFMVTQSKKGNGAEVNSESELSINTIMGDVGSGGQLVDVRTSSEYASGHIDGSVNLSLQDIQAGTLPSVAKDKPVYVYCRSGSRSAQATAELKSAGFTNVNDLGGMADVQSLGGVVKS